MKLVCALKDYKFEGKQGELDVVLYHRADRPTRGSVGQAVREEIARLNLHPAPRAWDFLSLALAVTAADLAGHRRLSPDGWTREFDLEVAVADPVFWNGQQNLVNRLLGFLSTDRWNVSFVGGGFAPKPPSKPFLPGEECISLLSGGLDSFIGNLDLVAGGKHPLVVSQTVRGDAENQAAFAKAMGGGLRHLQMNHNAEVPNPETPSSQRARSLIFIAYGVLAATTLKRYHNGQVVTLYVCENGFISINPPLTDMRLGSLSTRTTNPVFFKLVHELMGHAALKVMLENPYRLMTKGEMLRNCKDQTLLNAHAAETTSCGRFLLNKYTHCGRCVPCQVRRAAFLAAQMKDTTKYVFKDLGKNDKEHAGFDDVRAVAMAVAEVKTEGLEKWMGTSVSTTILGDVVPLQAMVGRGLNELDALLKSHGVK